jgi:hypothetical protein
MASIAVGRPLSLIHVGAIAASAVLLGCGGESNTVQIHAEFEARNFTVGEFTADGAGFCPTGIALPSNVQPVEGTDGRQTFLQIQYECDDDSGIFFTEMILDIPHDVASDPASNLPEGAVGSEGWSLAPGIGDYADTAGSGEVTVEFDSNYFIFDGTLSTD